MNNALLRRIPKIDNLLALPEIRQACEEHPYVLVRELLKEETEALRQSLLAGTANAVPSAAALAAQVLERLRHGDYYSLRRVINATGVVLHTNLGRAPLGREAAEHVAAVAAGAAGVMVEVHNDPLHALCDGAQSIRPEEYDKLVRDVYKIREVAVQ